MTFIPFMINKIIKKKTVNCLQNFSGLSRERQLFDSQ